MNATLATIEKTSVKIAGVEHLHGDYYRVPLQLIHFAEGGPVADDEILTFRNPRNISGKAKGFSKEEMRELQESIRTGGLSSALELRVVIEDGKETLQLVNGERRYRCLLKLNKHNEDCYDITTDTFKKAKELYQSVECKVNSMSERMAWKKAFTLNDASVGIGDGCTVALIRQFRKSGWTDEQIMDVTGKSITWLKDTDELCGLDNETFDALTKDQINRSAALQLASIPDVERRLELLEQSRTFAQQRLRTIRQRLERELEAAENKVEIADAVVATAEFTGDQKELTAATNKASKLKSKINKKQQEKTDLDENGPRVTTKDLNKAKSVTAEAEGVEPDPKTLTRAKLNKLWYEPICKIIKNNGKGEDDADLEIDLDDARLTKLLLDGIEKGEANIVKLLKRHQQAKEKRNG